MGEYLSIDRWLSTATLCRGQLGTKYATSKGGEHGNIAFLSMLFKILKLFCFVFLIPDAEICSCENIWPYHQISARCIPPTVCPARRVAHLSNMLCQGDGRCQTNDGAIEPICVVFSDFFNLRHHMVTEWRVSRRACHSGNSLPIWYFPCFHPWIFQSVQLISNYLLNVRIRIDTGGDNDQHSQAYQNSRIRGGNIRWRFLDRRRVFSNRICIFRIFSSIKMKAFWLSV